MLECVNLTAGYSEQPVLKNISFLLPEGENLAILGPNGAGKSTLLKCIAGLLPFTGSMKAAGLDVGTEKRDTIARKIAILGQFSAAAYPFTVRQVVMMGRYVHLKGGLLREPGQEDREKVQKALEATGMQKYADRQVTALSGGQMQRVFLSQVLAQQPELVLLDEFTNHLDLKVQTDLMKYLNRWSAEPGHAMVGVLHDITLALQFSSYALVLRDGETIAYGPVEQVIRPQVLEQAYGLNVAAYMVEALERWQEIAARH